MRRREFITLLGGTAVTWPLPTRAQVERMRRHRRVDGLCGERLGRADSGLCIPGCAREAGVDGRHNLRIEVRWGAGEGGRISALAKELVELQPDAILGVTTPVIGALARETKTIPIVFTVVSDPIGGGFAASLAHPGGNITGFTATDPATAGKWAELLKEIAPRTERVALLFNPATVVALKSIMPSVQAAASSVGVQASAAPVHAKDEIEGVIATQARTPGGSLIVMPDPFNTTNRELIIALAARYGILAIYANRLFAESGGLISYGENRAEQFRQAAGYVDRILRGVKLADLPIQLPTKFELLINIKTAKTLGLNVPPLLLGRADEVIE